KSAGSGNACSWLDANRRSAHRVGSPGWVEPRRGAACSPAQSSGVTVTPSWFATGDGTEPAGVRDPAREREPSRRGREESEREQERGSGRERKGEGGKEKEGEREAGGRPAAMPTRGCEMAPAVTRTVRRAGPRSVARRGRRSSAATYWRRRAVAVAIGLAALVMAGKAGAALGGSPPAGPGRRPATSPYVRPPGGALWSSAAPFGPAPYPRPL